MSIKMRGRCTEIEQARPLVFEAGGWICVRNCTCLRDPRLASSVRLGNGTRCLCSAIGPRQSHTTVESPMKGASAIRDPTTSDVDDRHRRKPYGRDADPARTPTILNVDDDHAWRRLKSQLLTSSGYDVVEASTGETALALARE